MIDDMFKLTIDTVFSPSFTSDRANKFELVYCEKNSLYSETPLDIRSPFSTSLYPVEELKQTVGVPRR
jgi:hypothetical protein